MNGYVFLHRRLLEHPLWTRGRFTRGQAWVDLILRASYQDHLAIEGNRAITVKRGQVFTSQVALAARWGWNRETVRAFLRLLESLMMAAIETSKATDTGYTLITLLNYDLYQADGRTAIEAGSAIESAIETSFEQASVQHPPATINKGNKGKERTPLPPTGGDVPLQDHGTGTTESARKVEDPIPYAEIIALLNTLAGTDYRASAEGHRKHIRARWREGYRLPDFERAIGNQVAEWRGTKWEKFLRPETLFGPKFDGYRQSLTPHPGQHAPEEECGWVRLETPPPAST